MSADGTGDTGGGTSGADGGRAAESGEAAEAAEVTEVRDAEVTAAAAGAAEVAEPVWRGLPRALLTLRRLLLVLCMVPLTVATGVLLGILVGPVWAAFAAVPAGLLLWGWPLMGRNWRSWRYAERADDLLIQRGVLWREETVVPYGRMQLVEVESGPLQRKFGLASLKLRTAAAATDATVPGLDPREAERLRDRLTELGEARSAGL